MAYSELIKNFGKIRNYMRSFYVYGFRHRSEYGEKSARGYDNERRRIESWLGEHMSFGQDEDGKRIFLSIDSRSIPHNPLFRAFRTRSFTDRDIILHFYLLDILSGTELTCREDEEMNPVSAPGRDGSLCLPGAGKRTGLSIREIMEELTDLLNMFDEDLADSRHSDYFSDGISDEIPDESTVRKKLSEYVSLGILEREKYGRETLYRKTWNRISLYAWRDAIDYFSEALPLGVIGSFLLDRLPAIQDKPVSGLPEAPSGENTKTVSENYSEQSAYFRYKHHYILNALDGEIMCGLLSAMREKRAVTLTRDSSRVTVLPLKIYLSTQTGRQYLLAASAQAASVNKGVAAAMDFVPPTGASAQAVSAGKGTAAAGESSAIPELPFTFHRLDRINTVKKEKLSFCIEKSVNDERTGHMISGEKEEISFILSQQENAGLYAELAVDEKKLQELRSHIWGVACGDEQTLEHIEMTVYAGEEEPFIVQRLEREKRCGSIRQLDGTHWQFSADVYDAMEMLPWIRTFTGRITAFFCTNPVATKHFHEDLAKMAAMYGCSVEPES